MASKNRFNIVLGATINKEALQKELNKISETKVKINIDTEHLKTQIQNVFNGIKVNVSGTSGTLGSSARGAGGIKEQDVVHAKSITSSLDKQGKAIDRVVRGYDNAGRAVRLYYSTAENGSEKLIRAQREEGTLANKNIQTYEKLSARLKSLSANKQIATKSAKDLTQRLEDANKLTDEFDKNNRFKEIGQDISDSSKHTMTWLGMLKTAFDKFANFTPKIATSYRNVC